ncbi:hypothetical protein F5Y04DRAFT_290843 [Hypomontagnella monticulosa]|nr:hypothetical protein F5Y04DRAFT_290843 [Hypomontagnella monticulosa]
MTASNMNKISPVAGGIVDTTTRISSADIERVDAFARKQCKRARAAGPELEEIALTVRNLHTVLKHLKFEVEDPESPLSNVDDSAVYARQLIPILEDSEFALKQLDTILGKKHDLSSDGGSEATNGGMQMDGEKGWTMLESRERDMIDLISTKLAKQKLNIDMFLDTVQLQNPSKSRRMVDTTSANLDSIKDKMDAIASRIFQRNNSNLIDSSNEEELWEQFRDELDQAGFSRDVLRKNQDVIRAYIRQLDEQRSANGGNTPSVRGLLQQQQQYHPHPRDDHGLQITPYPAYPAPAAADLSPEDIPSSGIDEEKLFPSSRMKRLQEDDRRRSLPPPSMPDHPTYLSYDRHSSSGDDDDESMALMSTRELMAIDKRSADLALAMGNMHLQPAPPADISGANNYHMTSSSAPHPHYLPPPSASQPALLPSPSHAASGTPTATAGDQHAAQPRFVPPLLLGNDNSSTSPPTLRSHSVSGPVVPTQQYQQEQQRNARLAPDSKGREIPLDAKWTRIPRRLVSPEVLAGAGVRYEARPDFVAVLGELGRDEVAEFARKTAEVRGARRRSSAATGASAAPAVTIGNGNGVRKERRAEDRYHPNKYRNWDVIDEERRRRRRHKGDDRFDHDSDDDDDGVTYIVNSPHRRRRGSTASTISELYDSSDEGSSDSDSGSDGRDRERDRERHGSLSYSQSFPRSGSQHLDDYHRSRSQRRRSTTPATSSKYDYDYDDRRGSKARDRADSEVTDGGLARDDTDNGKGKGTKVYPVIVPPPSKSEKDGGKDKDGGAGTSPAATIKPKPILKNKNDDPHVRIDPTPQIIDEGSSSLPRSLPSYRRSERERERREKEREKDRERDRDRDRRDKDRDRDHDREKRYRSDRYTDRDREWHTDRDRDHNRDRDRDGKSDRHRDKDKEYYSSHRDRDREEEYAHRSRHRSHSHRYHGGSGGGNTNGASSSTARRDRDRDREYYDDHYTNTSGGTRGKEKDKEDRSSKKARNETLRAVSLGGAAAAMLSMLSEAAL